MILTCGLFSAGLMLAKGRRGREGGKDGARCGTGSFGTAMLVGASALNAGLRGERETVWLTGDTGDAIVIVLGKRKVYLMEDMYKSWL
jgi:hypothetical protein